MSSLIRNRCPLSAGITVQFDPEYAVINFEICNHISIGLGELQILYATKEIGKSQIAEILSKIRSNLIDLIMKLEKEIGCIEEINSEYIDNKEISKIVNATIIGHGNTFLIGDNNIQKITNEIQIGNIEELKSQLKNHGVEENDISELEIAIKEDKPDNENKRYGKKVLTWIKRMMNKAVDGSWTVGIAAAGNIIADLIKAYYGY